MQQPVLKYKKLHPLAVEPTYATEGSACFDLYAYSFYHKISSVGLQDTIVFNTGLAFEIPKGYVMKIYARSGMAIKYGLSLVNGVGIVDSDYRGEVLVVTTGPVNFNLCAFVDTPIRIAQAILVPYEQVSFEEAQELSLTGRGEGGFGSTGVN